jgi:hypothetical protein
MGQKAGEAVVS